MGYSVTSFFYLVIGIGVAVALWAGEDSARISHRMFRVLAVPFFWPIYIPVLLAGRSSTTFATVSPQRRSLDRMDQLINQVEKELETALRSLEGWAEKVLLGERDRIAELRMAWHQQADRIRELDQLLGGTSIETIISEPSDSTAVSFPDRVAIPDETTSSVEASTNATDRPIAQKEGDHENQVRAAACERTRQENISKLKRIRTRMHDNLTVTLAWVRELVTMIHLAKYTGAPASRAEELVQQIAAAVEGLSDAIHYTT